MKIVDNYKKAIENGDLAYSLGSNWNFIRHCRCSGVFSFA
jgi:hypothetical protein